MPRKNKTRQGQGWLFWYVPLLLAELAWLIGYLIHDKNVAVVNPQGLISRSQVGLLIFTSIVLFAVAIPTVLFLYFTAWKYRETNTKAVHDPAARHSKSFVFAIWAIPSFFMLILMFMMYPATHRLEPRKSLASNKAPLKIQVISMRWKWVFLYPEQKIATVNYVEVPEDTPVEFELTADEAPMSSFWIPNLGGQLYSMTGHVNKLNLLAENPGDYPGSSAEINGAGFADMKFVTRVSTVQDFDFWVKQTKRSPNVLDAATYDKLVKPSENDPQAFYSGYDDGLYDRVVMKYMGSHGGHAGKTEEESNHDHTESHEGHE